MVDFYARVLGFTVTDRGALPGRGELVFLSRLPDEHHQIVLVTGRPRDVGFTTVNQLSFRLPSLEDSARGARGDQQGARLGVPPREPRQRLVGLLPRPRGQPDRAARGHALVHAAALRRAARPLAAGRRDPPPHRGGVPGPAGVLARARNGATSRRDGWRSPTSPGPSQAASALPLRAASILARLCDTLISPDLASGRAGTPSRCSRPRRRRHPLIDATGLPFPRPPSLLTRRSGALSPTVSLAGARYPDGGRRLLSAGVLGS